MPTQDELDRLIEAGAALLGIRIEAEWREAIRLQLDVSLRHAANVASFPLPDEIDPAPVFRA